LDRAKKKATDIDRSEKTFSHSGRNAEKKPIKVAKNQSLKPLAWKWPSRIEGKL